MKGWARAATARDWKLKGRRELGKKGGRGKAGRPEEGKNPFGCGNSVKRSRKFSYSADADESANFPSRVTGPEGNAKKKGNEEQSRLYNAVFDRKVELSIRASGLFECNAREMDVLINRFSFYSEHYSAAKSRVSFFRIMEKSLRCSCFINLSTNGLLTSVRVIMFRRRIWRLDCRLEFYETKNRVSIIRIHVFSIWPAWGKIEPKCLYWKIYNEKFYMRWMSACTNINFQKQFSNRRTIRPRSPRHFDGKMKVLLRIVNISNLISVSL